MAGDDFKDLADAVGDLLSQLLWWVALVAAIAIGVALGIYLFARDPAQYGDLRAVTTPACLVACQFTSRVARTDLRMRQRRERDGHRCDRSD